MIGQLGCARPGCGHTYEVHDEDVCDSWVEDGGRVHRCRCRGFLWVDPAGHSGGYSAPPARRAEGREEASRG